MKNRKFELFVFSVIVVLLVGYTINQMIGGS